MNSSFLILLFYYHIRRNLSVWFSEYWNIWDLTKDIVYMDILYQRRYTFKGDILLKKKKIRIAIPYQMFFYFCWKHLQVVAVFNFYTAIFSEEGNSNLLQYSCLENPMDRGAWWAAVHGSWRVEHNWATSLSLFTFMHWRSKWQPTPVFLPGESRGLWILVGCYLWGCTESDPTEAI